MLAQRPRIEPRLVPHATSVVVKEIYLSLQGESSHQGLLCTFVRLTGCHLRCTYCDSAFAFRGGQRVENAEVVARVLALGAPLVEVTGGEPLLQPGVYPLLQALLDAGLVVLLETSGAIDVRLVPPKVHKIVDLKTPSSGEADRNDPAQLRLDERQRRAEVRHRQSRRLRLGPRANHYAFAGDPPILLAVLDRVRRAEPPSAGRVDHRRPAAGALSVAAAQVPVGS
jgi:organic radical activating enzyme